MTYKRDFQFSHAGNKYCAGVYTDNFHMYVLVVSEFNGLAGGYETFIYKKDLIRLTDDYLGSVDIYGSSGVSDLLIKTFVVKSENGERTLFFGGSSNVFD